MRKVLLFLCVAALLQSVAFGDVIGSWAKVSSGGTDVWTLTVKPNAGEDIGGFNAWLEPVGTSFLYNAVPGTGGSQDTYAGVDQYTHFLVQLTHGSGKSAVQDAGEIGGNYSGVDSGDLYTVVGAVPVAGGIYYNGSVLGWTSQFAVLQLAVPTAGDPFYASNSVPSGLHGLLAQSDDGNIPSGATDDAPESDGYRR